MKHIILFFQIFALITNSFAAEIVKSSEEIPVIGMGMNPSQGFAQDQGDVPYTGGPSPQRGLRSIAPEDASCVFSPELSATDRGILDDGKNTLLAIKKDCQGYAPQVDVFNRALTAYDSFQGGSAGVYPGRLTLTCGTYENQFNAAQRAFMENYKEPPEIAKDLYGACSDKETEEAARACAQDITASSISNYRAGCDVADSAQRRIDQTRLIEDSFRSGMQAFQSIMNDRCLGDNSAQKASFIQSGLNLASQAAAIPFGSLGAMAASFITSGIGALFNNPNRDMLNILENKVNYGNLACLYNKMENKARRCDQLSAGAAARSLSGEFASATTRSGAFCADTANAGFQDVNDFVESLGRVVSTVRDNAPAEVAAPAGGAAPPPSSQAPQAARPGRKADDLNNERLDIIVDSLSQTFPGSSQSILDVGTDAATQVKARLEGIVGSTPQGPINDQGVDDYVRAHWSEMGASVWVDVRAEASGRAASAAPAIAPLTISSAMRRRAVDLIRNEVDVAAKTLGVLSSIRGASSSGRTPDQVRAVMASMTEYKGDFTNNFNMLLSRRAETQDGDIASRVQEYNSKISPYIQDRSVIRSYNRLTSRSQQANRDQGLFEDTKRGLQRHLKALSEKVLARYQSSASANLSSMPPSAPRDEVDRVARQTEFSNTLGPLIMACNQLKSIVEDGERLSPNRKFGVCNKFACPDRGGSKTFPQFAASQNPALDISSCRDESCPAYSLYVCEETKSNHYRDIEKRLNQEFLNNGTVCGRSMADILN